MTLPPRLVFKGQDWPAETLDAFFAGYGTAALDEETRDWFVRLYDYF